MSKLSQQRAVANFRNRLAEKGLVRFEVTGRNSNGSWSGRSPDGLPRAGLNPTDSVQWSTRPIDGEPPPRGGILSALIASPLIGSELDLTRSP